MGVSNFKELLKIIDFKHCWEEVKIEKVDVIIDGAALYYFLYFNSDPKLDQRCGGDYPGFKDEVCKFFETLQNCKVTPHVILDGATDPDKHTTSVSRLGDKLIKAKEIAENETDGTSNERYVLPPLVKDVFIEILREKGIKFKVCLGEADPEVVSEANQKNCAVLSKDTDFCIYKLHKGFLHLDHFLWKNKEDKKIPAKLYKRSKFCKLFKLDPTLMPVFASLAGNDYFKFKYKLKDIPAHKNERDLSMRENIKVLDRMLCILSDVKLEGLTHSDKILKALDYLKDSKILAKFSEEENKKFKTSIEKYDKLETQNTSSNLPSWVCKKVEDGKLTSFVISVLDQKEMMLTPLVEDFSQQSSYTTASCIRQYFYGLLTKDEITEHDRDGKEIIKKLVQPIAPSSDEQNQLQLQHLHKVLRLIIKYTSDLENIPDQLKLPVCVTVFWFKKLQDPQKPEIVNCLHKLLLVSGSVAPKLCLILSVELKTRMKALKDEGVSIWQPRVAHAFSQWQSCMRQSLHLNQLLCSPLPEPQCSRLYCGPLLHWLADEDKINQLQLTLAGQKKKLYETLKRILITYYFSQINSDIRAA
uniref:Asteroid domain-containing protein n=1 Tax=Oreochromis niloticus TaxID=8128 RepID=I3K1I1_ORENI